MTGIIQQRVDRFVTLNGIEHTPSITVSGVGGFTTELDYLFFHCIC